MKLKTIPPDLLIPEISVDLEMNFSDFDEKFMRILKQFEPFGPENMTPVFVEKYYRFRLCQNFG